MTVDRRSSSAFSLSCIISRKLSDILPPKQWKTETEKETGAVTAISDPQTTAISVTAIFNDIIDPNSLAMLTHKCKMVPLGRKVLKRENVVPWDDYFMSVAFLSAMRSKDPSTQVGACIVNKDNRIVGIGQSSLMLLQFFFIYMFIFAFDFWFVLVQASHFQLLFL